MFNDRNKTFQREQAERFVLERAAPRLLKACQAVAALWEDGHYIEADVEEVTAIFEAIEYATTIKEN